MAKVATAPLADSIYEIHGFLAALAQQPRIAIDKEDSRKLAGAITEVGKHLPLPQIKPHHAAIAALVYTAGRIYVPMVRDIAAGRDTPRTDKADAQTVEVAGADDAAEVAGNWFGLQQDTPQARH